MYLNWAAESGDIVAMSDPFHIKNSHLSHCLYGDTACKKMCHLKKIFNLLTW